MAARAAQAMQQFYADLKAQTRAVGRDPNTIKSLPGIVPVIGSTEAEALELDAELENGAADGFNVMPPVFPSGLERFVEHVVRILQMRGLFRSEYEGTTLREHYGLARPDNANLQRSRLVGTA